MLAMPVTIEVHGGEYEGSHHIGGIHPPGDKDEMLIAFGLLRAIESLDQTTEEVIVPSRKMLELDRAGRFGEMRDVRLKAYRCRLLADEVRPCERFTSLLYEFIPNPHRSEERYVHLEMVATIESD